MIVKRRAHLALFVIACHLHLSICKETELSPTSTSSFLKKTDACSNQNINETNSCRPNLGNVTDVTPNTLIQRVTNRSTPNREGKFKKGDIPNGKEVEVNKESSVEVNDAGKLNSVSKVDSQPTPAILDEKKTAPVFEEMDSEKEKISLAKLNHEILVDKRSSLKIDSQSKDPQESSGNGLNAKNVKLDKFDDVISENMQNTSNSHNEKQEKSNEIISENIQTSSAALNTRSAKLEKSNEVIPASTAEETIMATPGDVEPDVDEQNTIKVNIVNTVDPITEAPGTTVAMTEGGQSGETVTTPVLVTDDDDGKLTHKTTSISRNTITKVAVQDCPCDVIRNVCDINCCCDNDCSAYDRAVFSHCLPLPSLSSSQYCFSKQLIYIKNSPYYISKSPDNSLLCIETENLKSRTNFTNLKPISSARSFTKVIERRTHSEWSRAVLRATSPYSPNRLPHNQSYKVGQPIWMLNNTSVKVFELPCHSILSDGCSTRQPIFYLQDAQSDCVAQLNDCLPDNVLSSIVYYRNFLLLASTSFENLTSMNNCTKQSCLSVEPYSCRDNTGGSCTLITEDLPPIWDPDSRACVNVTQSVHYVFKHNGTQGIVKVMLYLRLSNVSLRETVRLKTKVSFEWHNSYERSFHRSGNPGYRTRAPLISGTRLFFNQSQEDQTIPSIHFSTSPRDWITMLTFTHTGECNDLERRNLLFGINEQVTCSFMFNQKQFTDCDSIQYHIYKLLLGNVKPWDTDTYIGSNGDPSIYNIDDWVPILWSKSAGQSEVPTLPCGNLATGVNVRVLHAFSGLYSNPDAKVIGVLIEAYKHSVLTCVGLRCRIELAWSASFVHSRNSRFTKFPEPPVYEIKLPSNFFYPFLSSAGRNSSGRLRFFVLILCLMFSRLVNV